MPRINFSIICTTSLLIQFMHRTSGIALTVSGQQNAFLRSVLTDSAISLTALSRRLLKL